MRATYVYLAAYFALLVGAGLTLWQAGVLGRLSAGWTAAAAVVAVGLGAILALISTHPAVRDD